MAVERVIERAPMVVLPHALSDRGREVVMAAFQPKETLGSYCKRAGIVVPRGELKVFHNGHPVPAALWDKLIPRTGDQIVIRAIGQGGGGGSKILRTVAMVALVVAANAWGGALGTALGLTGKMAIGVGSAIIMLGGSLLINTILPPPKPTKLDSGSKYETSPTYSLSGGRNSMRLWEPMTLVFGEHKVVPDMGAKPFTERVGDDQYLNQLFHFGLQADSVGLSDFKIGATPLSDYKDVQIQVADSNGKLTLFPGNVDTIEGFTLESGVVNSRTTEDDVTSISVDLAAQLFNITDAGKYTDVSVEVRVQYRRVGVSSWQDAGEVGSSYATHYWSYQRSNGYQMDYGSTNYADHTDGERELVNGQWLYWRWVPHPHAQGKPWRGVAPDPLLSTGFQAITRLKGAKQTPTYKSVTWSVPRGRYEIRVWKVSADIKDGNGRKSNEVAVNQILAFQIDDADYTGQLRVALRIKATSQLNGAVDEFSALAKAKAPVWDGKTITKTVTSNPAWWFLFFALGKVKVGQGRLYGAGLALSQVDIEAIRAWAAWCDRKRLSFNYVLDRKVSGAEMLQVIARCGRASPTWQSGKLGVVWDAENQPSVGMFGPFNIKAGSFKVDYINDNTPDEIILNFANKTRDYKMDEVRVKVPGATATLNPLQLDLEGCTNADMAGREANLIAASQIWHRRRVSWETDIEGWIASRGDVVEISHDLTVWGYSGRLLDCDGRTLLLSQHIPTGSGVLMLRDPEGNMKTVYVEGVEGETDTVTVTSDLQGFSLPGEGHFQDTPAMDWAYFFDPQATPGRRFKITEVQPLGDDGVRFSAVDDDAGYYASESNPYVHVPPRDGSLLAGWIFGLGFVETVTDAAKRVVDVRINWSPSSDVRCRVVVKVNGIEVLSEETASRHVVVQAVRGDVVQATVTPITLAGAGKQASSSHVVVAKVDPPTAPTGLSVSVEGDMLRLAWRESGSAWVEAYEVALSDERWGSDYLFRGSATSCLVHPGAVDIPVIWHVRTLNAAGLYSEVSVNVSYTVERPADIDDITIKFADTSLTNATVTLDWQGVDPVFGLAFYRIGYGDVVKQTKATTITLPADWIGDRTFTVQVVDDLGNASLGFSRTVTKLAPKPPLNVRAQVIDNNVLLYWELPEMTTLPVSHVHVREGDDWETGREIGTKSGSFTSLSELQAGRYQYWLATVDTDGHESTPVSIVASVSEPPDFVFRGEQISALDGELVNAAVDGARIILPVNTEETWEQHFAMRSWDTPQAQVDAGYPIYIQPTLLQGSYSEVFDFGTVVATSRATITFTGKTLAGEVSLLPRTELSLDGESWTPYEGMSDVFGTNFQYVRFTLTVEQAGNHGLYQLTGLSCRLSTKLKNDGGRVECKASDARGTVANFNVTFLDVSSITLTPAGTTPVTAVYDFKDVVQGGTYVVNAEGVMLVTTVSHGFEVGQDVQINIISGAAKSQRVQVISATADNFTVRTRSSASSGRASIYAQSMRVYLFNQQGARASGVVSWAIKGNG